MEGEDTLRPDVPLSPGQELRRLRRARRRRRSLGRLGYPPEVHGSKLAAWTLRLRAARHGLDKAVRAGDRRQAAARLEDVWFSIGRLTGEGLAASESAEYADDASAALREVRRSYTAARQARAGLGGA